MFGYVRVNKGELKVKDYERYKGYYCGLCSALKERYGLLGQITLTYDMTFIVVFLTGLYEEKDVIYKEHCIMNPFKKHMAIRNRFTEYAADMNMLLAYYKLLDDYQDDKDFKSLIMAALIRKRCNKAARENKRQATAIRRYIIENKACEEGNEKDYDKVSGCTGRMLAELLCVNEDEWSDYLRNVGFYLGKFIYLMDAWDDLEDDIKSGNYNPLKQLADDDEKEKKVKDMLAMMATEAAAGFESMPIFKNADILRNILYSGIWSEKQGDKCEKSV